LALILRNRKWQQEPGAKPMTWVDTNQVDVHAVSPALGLKKGADADALWMVDGGNLNYVKSLQ